jgi:transposase
MAYSLDLRERIVEAVAEGQKHAEVAARFKVGVVRVRRYLSRSRAGELAAKAPPGRSALIPAEAYERRCHINFLAALQTNGFARICKFIQESNGFGAGSFHFYI